jgi:alpha-tubulin suppressor-like RCC1 family protein
MQVSAACNNSLVLDNSGAVYIMGKFQSTDCQTPVKVDFPLRVRFVSGGDFFTAMITCTDELYTFGDDSYGQLGLGMLKYVRDPTRVEGLDDVDKVCTGSNHMAVLLKNGKVYTWGKGTSSGVCFF